MIAGVFLIVMSVSAEPLLVDDFAGPNGMSRLGTQWEGFTDRVMGGISDMQVGYRRDGERTVLRMVGKVSLENNGGFIQVRLPLAANDSEFDASDYAGVAVEFRGIGDHYAVHLRTSRTRLPWAYYYSKLPASGTWQRVEIPFASFEGQYMLGGGTPNTKRLKSIAIVAGEAEFDADISIGRVELYR